MERGARVELASAGLGTNVDSTIALVIELLREPET